MSKIETVKELNIATVPYSAVTIVDGHYHFSGVVPDLENGELVSPGDIKAQTRQVLVKMKNLLEICGLSFKSIYDVTLMLGGSMDHFPKVNEIYAEAFAGSEIKPARKAFAVVELPFQAKVEIQFSAVPLD